MRTNEPTTKNTKNKIGCVLILKQPNLLDIDDDDDDGSSISNVVSV